MNVQRFARSIGIAGAAAIALASVPTALWAAGGGYGVKEAKLEAFKVPGGAGAKGASGRVIAEVDADEGEFCYSITLDKLDDVGVITFHKGAADVSGETLFEMKVTGDNADACLNRNKAELADILAHPSGYYVLVTSKALPDGARRGQLE